MKFRAKEPAWFDMKYLTKGTEFDAPEDFDAPWAECLEEKVEHVDRFHVPTDDNKPTAQDAEPETVEVDTQVEEPVNDSEPVVEPEPSKPAKKPRTQRKPTAKNTTVE